MLILVGISCNKDDNFKLCKRYRRLIQNCLLPVIATNGDKVVAITQNTTYNEAGASATLK